LIIQDIGNKEIARLQLEAPGPSLARPRVKVRKSVAGHGLCGGEENGQIFPHEEKYAMHLNRRKILEAVRRFSLPVLLTLLGGTVAAVQPLDNPESDGYLQWLHSLEKAVTAREAAGSQEGNLLYPFGIPGWEGDQAQPFRHLAISRAIGELEAQWQLRGQDRETSALVALAHARNYTNLSEFDSALVWYEAAGKLDTLGLFHTEIMQERMAVASALGDSMRMSQLVTNTLGAPDLGGRDRELVLAYRWLLTGRDSETLALLLDKVESQDGLLAGEVLFWHAFSQAWLEERNASLANLRLLVRSGGLSGGLTEQQRTWVALAIPDQMFLLGAREQARSLYQTLQASSLDQVRVWATYQLANINFLNAEFDKAANGFDLVCEARRLGSWQDQACSMADIARELDRIRSEGEPYGTASYYNP
jgi:hypothetical protein